MGETMTRRLVVVSLCLLVLASASEGGAPAQTPAVTEAKVLKEFPSYRHPAGHYKRNIVIAPGPSLEALVALAKRLHHEDPETSFRIFTDGNVQQFHRYRLWDLHYAKDDSAKYPYPKAWADRHNIAFIHRFWYRGARTWLLQVDRGSALVPPVKWGTSVSLE
jgi:hypothetical protein